MGRGACVPHRHGSLEVALSTYCVAATVTRGVKDDTVTAKQAHAGPSQGRAQLRGQAFLIRLTNTSVSTPIQPGAVGP